MTEAFKCNICDEYRDGKPARELYEKGHSPKNETVYEKVADVCEDCDESKLED